MLRLLKEAEVSAVAVWLGVSGLGWEAHNMCSYKHGAIVVVLANKSKQLVSS